ncbi:MAG: flotillin-like protein FloA [Clostridia bacterium]|nr:flotillin-like protein FloA [Clostridia bacterium]
MLPDFMIVWLIIIVVAIVIAAVFFRYVPLGLWINARASGAPVKIVSLIGMRFRRISPQKIVNAYIKARKAGLDVTTDMLETHFLAGGNVERVINALISAKQASINLSFTTACAIDLAGRDVLQAVQMSVLPKVIETPPVAAIAQDGIELRAKARVTVRTNIERLVGGAGEETIIARVGEGIVTTIGSSTTHKAVLENPDSISQTVLEKGLDKGTAYEILSIDIADIDVGRNIGAQLQMDQAEADRRIAQAKAEERRAMAVAHEQEMKAAVQEMRAKVVEAEAKVPLAMAEALREGKLGVMDYYQMQNTIADTEMRNGIAKAAAPNADVAKPLDGKK